MTDFFANLPVCVVGIESTGGAHLYGRSVDCELRYSKSTERCTSRSPNFRPISVRHLDFPTASVLAWVATPGCTQLKADAATIHRQLGMH